MKRILSGLALSLLASTAFAQSVTKAPVVPAGCTLTSCSGWIVGAGFMGQGSNLNIVGGGIQNSVFAGGGAIGVVGGYQFWNGAWFIEPNVAVYYDLSPNTQVALPTGSVGTNPSSKFLATEGVKMGTPIGNIIGQGQAPIAIPTSISNALLSPYFQFGAAERSFGAGWYIGAGAEFLLASDPRAGSWLLDIDYKAITYNSVTSQNAAGFAQVGTENWVGFTLLHKL